MKKVSFFSSIFVKGAMALVLCIGAVTTTLALLNYSGAEELSRVVLAKQAREVTGLLAKLSGGPTPQRGRERPSPRDAPGLLRTDGG